MKKTILVVEDDDDILFTLAAMLENAGYEVKQLSSGKTIMDGTCTLPDLYILDKRMPDMDGLDICRFIKKELKSQQIPVIVISASPKFGPQALKAGANAFLEKPFQMKSLLEMVKSHLNFTKG